MSVGSLINRFLYISVHSTRSCSLLIDHRQTNKKIHLIERRSKTKKNLKIPVSSLIKMNYDYCSNLITVRRRKGSKTETTKNLPKIRKHHLNINRFGWWCERLPSILHVVNLSVALIKPVDPHVRTFPLRNARFETIQVLLHWRQINRIHWCPRFTLLTVDGVASLGRPPKTNNLGRQECTIHTSNELRVICCKCPMTSLRFNATALHNTIHC